MNASSRPPTSKRRLLSGLAAGAFGLVVVALGGWWFTLAVGVIVHLGLLEFFRLAQFKGIRPATKTTLVVCQVLLVATQWASGGGLASDLAAAVLPVSGAAICGWLLLQPITGTIADIAASIFGLFYLGFLPSHWLRLRDLSDAVLAPHLVGAGWPFSSGMALTLIACLMVVATDIGSYVIGRRLGRHPLSPISPGKTVEGALGGVVCSLLVGVIGGLWLGWPWGWAVGGGLGAIVSLFALVGDLTESMMKRDAGVKDSGDAIPGHGGILDRIDSYLFTPAVVFYYVTLVVPLLNRPAPLP
ncbi:phosphatidate cytidylyltransferase [Synechococcus sp. ATX 2A4]|uniref:phosphatidate cytidylyltransferase n=1 Tax=Synechococcus sp. ATX 2A4 TaxID=2823727 RepID=UPI0020CB739E|nr:phosphatidate cytidylyltransferase [Synechococcus sp. ATX 2A4]MCP9883858.1 phosphatidate cytidylyltransferase [Synechococcus sp. ATX 2A4]